MVSKLLFLLGFIPEFSLMLSKNNSLFVSELGFRHPRLQFEIDASGIDCESLVERTWPISID
jgi:hypothetical protein